MAQQSINIGAAPNDGTGDPLRTALQKTNANFTELYSGKQDIDATLTALAGLSWTAGSQIAVFTATDVASLRTIGQAAGNILDKDAGDALYQPLDATLTELASLTWTAGIEIPAFTAADTTTMLTVGQATGNILDKAAGDALYASIGHNHTGTYQLEDPTLTALAGVSWTAGAQVLTLTAADTFTLRTVGQAAGNILDKAAGDALYQGLDPTLTALSGATWTTGTQVLTFIAADTIALRTVGQSAGNILDKTAGDALYAPLVHTHVVSDVTGLQAALDAKQDDMAVTLQTASTYTLVLADAGDFVQLSDATGVALTVPTNASVAYPIGTQIKLEQVGTGQITVAGDVGVTVNSRGGFFKTNAQWSVATLTKTGTDTWNLSGDLVL